MSLTDGTLYSINKPELYKHLNKNDGVELLFLPFREGRGGPSFYKPSEGCRNNALMLSGQLVIDLKDLNFTQPIRKRGTRKYPA